MTSKTLPLSKQRQRRLNSRAMPPAAGAAAAPLGTCSSISTVPRLARSEAEVNTIAALLASSIPFYKQLAPTALNCAARHVRLVDLNDGAPEWSARSESDASSLFGVLAGKLWILQGSRQDPWLQRMQQHWRLVCHQQALLTAAAADAAASNAAAETGTNHQQPSSVSFWRVVRDEVVAAQKQRIQSAGIGGAMHTLLADSSDLQTTSEEGAVLGDDDEVASPTAAALAAPTSSTAVGITALCLEDGACFSGDGLEWSLAGAAAIGLVQGEGQLQQQPGAMLGLPPRCIAAVTDDAGCAVQLVRMTQEALFTVLRLNAQAHVAAIVPLCCRVPSLRHTPVRELHRLARHLRWVSFQPGEVLLHQGREITGVFILHSGTVQLQVHPRPHHQAAWKAAATNSSNAAALRAEASSAVDVGGAVVLGSRGPGALLGDDFLRERRMACSVVALTQVRALRLPPHKLPQVLDPLTLRLLDRLRQQQSSAAAAALLAEGESAVERAAAAAEHRATVLASTYGAGGATSTTSIGRAGSPDNPSVPATLLRDEGGGGPSASVLLSSSAQVQRPQWKVARRIDASGTVAQAGQQHCSSKQYAASASRSPQRRPRSSSSPTGCGEQQRGSDEDEAAWMAALPRGLTEAKCARRTHTCDSVRQVVAGIRELEAARRSAAPVHSAPGGWRLPVSKNCCTHSEASAAAGDGAADSGSCSIAGNNVRSCGYQNDTASDHTSALESACVGIVDILLLDGQPQTEDEDAVAVAIDDAVAKFVAVVHDAGLRLIRWGPTRYVLLAELPIDGEGDAEEEEEEEEGDADEGASSTGGGGGGKKAVVRAAANSLLLMQHRLAAVVTKAACPHLRFTAGLAMGTCFLQSTAGDFVQCVSGRAYSAAERLLHLAATLPSSTDAIIVSDSVQQLILASHDLQPIGGGFMLISAFQLLARNSSYIEQSVGADETAESLRSGGLFKAPTLALGALQQQRQQQRSAKQQRKQAAAVRRQMIRRKYEALELLLAQGEGLLRAPEHLLTQPPPAPGTQLGAIASSEAAGRGGPASLSVAGRFKSRLMVRVDDGSNQQVIEQEAAAGGTPKTPSGAAEGDASSAPSSPSRWAVRSRGGRSAVVGSLAGDRGGVAAGGAAGSFAAVGSTTRTIQTRLQVWQEVEQMRLQAGGQQQFAPPITPKTAARISVFAAAAAAAAAAEQQLPSAVGGGPTSRPSTGRPGSRAGTAAGGRTSRPGSGGDAPTPGQREGLNLKVTFAAVDGMTQAGQARSRATSATAASPASAVPSPHIGRTILLPTPTGAARVISSSTPLQRHQQIGRIAAGVTTSRGGALKHHFPISRSSQCSSGRPHPLIIPSDSAVDGRTPQSLAAPAFNPAKSSALPSPPHCSPAGSSAATVINMSSCRLYQLPDLVSFYTWAVNTRLGGVDLLDCQSIQTRTGKFQTSITQPKPWQDHMHRADSLAASFNNIASLMPSSGSFTPRQQRQSFMRSRSPSPEQLGAKPALPTSRASTLGTLGVLPLAPSTIVIPSGIGRLPPHLTSLCLSFNEVWVLPSYLVAALPMLELLDLSFNRCIVLAAAFFERAGWVVQLVPVCTNLTSCSAVANRHTDSIICSLHMTPPPTTG